VSVLRTGISQIPLHGGQCPPWLFAKMKKLAAVMLEVIVYEYGTGEVLRRLADPVWFQTFGCILGFDWHSSGLTTVVCGALKEGLKELQGELGLFFAGGKGKISRQTPVEIALAGEKYGLSNDLHSLQRTSRLVAKVDSAAVQDGYDLYHHFFIFNRKGNWTIVQQGMNEEQRYARRYHWLSDGLESYVNNPHRGICGINSPNVLNLVSSQNVLVRNATIELCQSEKPQQILHIIDLLQQQKKQQKRQLKTVDEQMSLWSNQNDVSLKTKTENIVKVSLPSYHPIPAAHRLDKVLYRIYEKSPHSYEALLEEPGVGKGTLRALAMVAEVTHGVQATFQDPVRYSFAHGGKDGYPFPVNKSDMEHSIAILRSALEKSKIGSRDKLFALQRLAGISQNDLKIL
jgi:hypothetical protein